MLNITICDNNELERNILKHIISTFFTKLNQRVLFEEYESGEELIFDTKEGYLKTELICMDIVMDGITGMETAHKLRERGDKTPIVFFTSSPEYAIEGYDVAAAGYIMKPYRTSYVHQVLQRLYDHDFKYRIRAKYDCEFYYIPYQDILYIESSAHNLEIHTSNSDRIYTKTAKLSDIEKQLSSRDFMRIQQSIIVNLNHVSNVCGDFFIMDNGESLPMRVRGRKEVTDAYYEYFKSKYYR